MCLINVLAGTPNNNKNAIWQYLYTRRIQMLNDNIIIVISTDYNNAHV